MPLKTPNNNYIPFRGISILASNISDIRYTKQYKDFELIAADFSSIEGKNYKIILDYLSPSINDKNPTKSGKPVPKMSPTCFNYKKADLDELKKHLKIIHTKFKSFINNPLPSQQKSKKKNKKNKNDEKSRLDVGVKNSRFFLCGFYAISTQ